MNHPFFAALKAAPEKIPDLKPPRGTIAPTLWEAHGWALIALLLIFCALVAVLVRRWRRPKPVLAISPAEIARRELAALRTAADPSRTVSEASRVLRRFLIAKFGLAGPGLTAQEIAGHLPARLALAAELQHFLETAETANFAPETAAPRRSVALEEIERLVEAVEAQTPPPLPVAR